jgi:hypothetical protein
MLSVSTVAATAAATYATALSYFLSAFIMYSSDAAVTTL